MSEQIIPIFRVSDAEAALEWYSRLGFERDFEHRFARDLPLYLGIRRGEVRLHLSEHAGDGRTGSVVYFWVEDVDAIAADFGGTVEVQPWARETTLSDPDGNHLRIGQRQVPEQSSAER